MIEGWIAEKVFMVRESFGYRTSGKGFIKRGKGIEIYISVHKDEKKCIVYLSTGHKDDGILELGEFPYDVEMIDKFAQAQIDMHGVTKEDLLHQYNNLQYFNKELTPVDTEAIYAASQDKDLSLTLLEEMLFVNRLTTISRCFTWEDAHAHRPFHQKLFKQKIVNPKSETDQFGNIHRFGMKMSNKQFDVYKEFHDEIFEITE